MLIVSDNVLDLGYSFGLARNPIQRSQALQLRRDIYIRRGLILGNAATLHVPPQTFVPDSAILIASRHGSVVGTVSVYADCDVGLPMDKIHPIETKMMREKGKKLAEIGGLAVSETERNLNVTVMLYYTLFRWCLRCQFDGLIVCAHPSVRRVYQSWLFFDVLGPAVPHPTFNNALSLPMGLQLGPARERFMNAYRGAQRKFDLYTFFCESEFPLDFPEPSTQIYWSPEELAVAPNGFTSRTGSFDNSAKSEVGPAALQLGIP